MINNIINHHTNYYCDPPSYKTIPSVIKWPYTRGDMYWGEQFRSIILSQLHLKSGNRIGDVMVIVLVSSAVDRGFEPRSGQTKDYKIGICCFSAKHAAVRRKNKDWLVQNQDNVSEWGNMSIRRLLFQLTSVVVSYKADLIIISLTINLFSPWHSWTNCWVGIKQKSL